MIKAIIVDSEPASLNQLQSLLSNYDNIKIVGSFEQPSEALKEMKNLSPSMLITDIPLNEMDGFELAQHAIELVPSIHVVFLCTNDAFALKAFEVGAFDYMLKPINGERLDKLIKRMVTDITTRRKSSIGESPNPVNKQFKNFITVNKADSIFVINKTEIVYCCASNKKTYIYLEDGCYECRYTLEQLETMLKPHFFRCHRGYLVNVQYIRELAPMFNQTYIIKLKNSRAEVPVSRNYAAKIKEFFNF